MPALHLARVRRPNILLLVFDTARADAFEPYGAAHGASPATAQLGARGATFPHAYAAGSWTVPSHGAMFAGELPLTLGLEAGADTGRPRSFHARLHAVADRLLPSVFARNGYATAAVSTNLWVSEQSGFDAGFDEFRYVGTGRGAGAGAGWRSRLLWDLEALRARVDDGAHTVERLLGDWLAARRHAPEQPFFWFVNLLECHSPYLPPRPYNDLPVWARVRAGEEARRYLTFEAMSKACLGRLDVPAGALERMRYLYARAILLLDDWLARLLDTLDRAGVLDDTIVVMTSDHGENFGENGLLGHSFSLDDRLIRVPLVAAGPGVEATDAVFSLADLPAELAAWAGVSEHPWGARRRAGGVAVAQFAAPGDPGHERTQEVVRSWQLDEAAQRRLIVTSSCATDGRYKLLRGDDGLEEVIDLTVDPLEMVPRRLPGGTGSGAIDPARLAALRAALDAADAARSDGADPPADAGPPDDAEPPDDEAAALEAQMKLLGYM